MKGTSHPPERIVMKQREADKLLASGDRALPLLGVAGRLLPDP